MANNHIYRWRVAVQEDGTYAYLYIVQYDFTGFSDLTVTDHRVVLGSIAGCKIADNPGERGLYLNAFVQQDDGESYHYGDDEQCVYRDRIRDYWRKIGKPTADCDAPDVDVPWFPWEVAGFTRQEALRTIAVVCYGLGRCSVDCPNTTEKLALFGVSAAEIDKACAVVTTEGEAAHAAHMAGSLRADRHEFDEFDAAGVSNG